MPVLTERLRNNFFLETMIPQYAENLKSLRGFKFDWRVAIPNYDHVYANQALTHKLNEYGIVHEAEEYNGSWGEGNWGEGGRIYTDVLPFFRRHLIFDANSDHSPKQRREQTRLDDNATMSFSSISTCGGLRFAT